MSGERAMLGRADNPWIQSAAWDGFWMLSGLWAPALVLITYVLRFGWPATSVPAFHQVHFVLGFTALALLHRLSSVYAVVISPILRSEVRANPRRYVHVPLAIVLGTLLLAQAFVFHPWFAFLTSPAHPDAQLWAFGVLAVALVVWDRWHFCMQEFGVLSLYRARARQLEAADRRFDRGYVVGLMLVVNSVLFLYAGFGDDRFLLWRPLSLGDGAQQVLQALARGACALGVVLWLGALLREWRHPERSLPKLLFYKLIASHSLILFWLPSALSLFFLGYICHHWLVAIGLLNRLSFGSYPTGSRWRRGWLYLRRVGPWLFVGLVLGAFFAPLDLTGRLTPLPDTNVFLGVGVAARCGAGLVIGGFFAFSFLHYYYDRCLYSFSVPGVRKLIAPLLLGEPTTPSPTRGPRASVRSAELST
ncbi:MAG: hypothetical protein ABW321_26445 [Polyangiales bacterium]